MLNTKWMKQTSFLLIITAILLTGCGDEPKEEIPDVSDIELSNKLIRFERAMAELDTNNLAESVAHLNAEHTAFYSVFFRNVLPFDTKTEEGFLSNLRGYLSDDRILKLQDTTAIVFKDFETETLPKLNSAMKYIKHYFPEFEAPNIYTFISEYTYQQFVFSDKDRDGIGIGLDMFLGEKYPYKQLDPNNPAFSKYLTRFFNKDHLPRKVAGILVDDLIGRPAGSKLLDQMIHNGKRLYILDRVMPMISDTILLEYTADQTKWVKENEISIWAFFFDEDLFYESNAIKINKYINPSPNSPGMPDAAPGRTANYIGWKIVEAYMERKKISIQELINEKNSQTIMDESRYKPKRK